MPKPFHIAIDVEEVALGKVIRQLNAMPGISRLHLDLDDQPKLNGRAGQKLLPPPSRKPAGDVLILAIMNGNSSSAKLREALIAYGYGKTSFTYHVTQSKEAGHVRSTGRGEYALTAKGKTAAQHIITSSR